MKRSSSYFIVALFILTAVFLAACGGSAADQTGESADNRPTKTPMPPPDAPLDEAAPPAAEAYPPAAPQDETADQAYPPPAAAPADPYPGDSAASAPGGMRTFAVLPEQSSATYLVDEEFLQDALSKLGINAGDTVTVGTTENVSGQIAINLDDLTLGATSFAADMTGLKTDQSNRDNWIRENDNGPQFARFPQATFVATGISGLSPGYSEGEVVQFQLSGDFTVRDTTLPLTFDITAKIEGDTLTATAEKRLLMTDLGITPPNFARTLSVADEFGIRVDIVAQEQ